MEVVVTSARHVDPPAIGWPAAKQSAHLHDEVVPRPGIKLLSRRQLIALPRGRGQRYYEAKFMRLLLEQIHIIKRLALAAARALAQEHRRQSLSRALR